VIVAVQGGVVLSAARAKIAITKLAKKRGERMID
jgi:hypothetical protein